MNRDKQIEEMTRETMETCRIDNQCGSCHWETCNECLAEALYNAGYRKASDVAREILQEVRQLLLNMVLANSMGETYNIEGKFADLEKKYESEGEG